MHKTTLVLIATLILIGGVIILTKKNTDTATSLDPTGKATFDKAPDFTFFDFEDNKVGLSDFPDTKVRIVNSWAVWCPFCRDELPDFSTLQKEFGDAVVVIAIDRAESVEKQREYLDSINITDELIFLSDPNDSFYKTLIGGFSMPETIFVDADNNIRIHKRGPMGLDEMREKVQFIISNPPT